MGEAKRRTARWTALYDALTPEQKTVADVSRAVWSRLVEPTRATGMCYRLALFLATYLDREYGVAVDPVIGYAHDGTTALMSSHAWIERDGRITDLSLAYTDHPEVQLPGEVLILDHVMRPGHPYAYRREQDAAAIDALERMTLDPQLRPLVEHKAVEHTYFSRIAADPEARLAYLDAAPDGGSYAVFARLLS